MLPLFHEDIEYLPMEEGGAIHGHAAIRRYLDRWMDPLESFEVGPTEFREAGDRVFDGVAMKGVGRSSGVERAMDYWQVWVIRDGLAARWEEYVDRTEALDAAGLSE